MTTKVYIKCEDEFGVRSLEYSLEYSADEIIRLFKQEILNDKL